MSPDWERLNVPPEQAGETLRDLNVLVHQSRFWRNAQHPCRVSVRGVVFVWLRELDLNQRPSGYEPDELPGCSIPRQGLVNGFLSEFTCTPAAMPGDDLLFHRLSDSTIGAVGFHGRVRDGIGWDTDAKITRQ